MRIHPPLAALVCEFPYPSLNLANYVAFNREREFLRGKLCLFCMGNFTMWVAEEHRTKLVKFMVHKARAVTEKSNAPCIVRKEVPITIKDAHELLEKCEIGKITVMQFGQKTNFGNEVVQWALQNVCYLYLFVCLCVLTTYGLTLLSSP
jgi:hypothetical protein